MAENAMIKIMTALLKHQVKKLVGEDALGVIGEELTAIGGDKLDDQVKIWLGEKTTTEELEKAADYALNTFREKVKDDDLRQWIVMLPLGDLPDVLSAIEELPTSPDEKKLEKALRDSISVNWKKLSSEQIENAVNVFMSSLRSAILPLQKQTLMVIGRSVLRTEDKVDLLIRWFERYIITGEFTKIEQLNAEPDDSWNLKHPYPMPPNFTGRVDERKMLVDWLNEDSENRLFILRALGGFGKSALTWHWLTHDVDPKVWKKIIFWSFYEGDASFENFITETLTYLNLEIPQGQRTQVDELLKALQKEKVLLIMDGFERVLRAYSSMNAAYQGDEEPKIEDNQFDCVNLNAEIFLKSICSLPNIKSKALMTTRLTPRVVKPRGEFMLGCKEIELTAMQKEDAVEFFKKQGIKGNHTEIESACAPYGYHPLSLRILAGYILKDFENPADIVVAQKLKIDGDIIQQKNHVMEVSYKTLSPDRQKLLSTIACFRSPVELKTLEAISEDKNSLNDNLRDLIERGLLHFDNKNKTFDLHPIVRRFAYDQLTSKDRTDAHERLVNYFEAIPKIDKVEKLEDLAPVIELYHHTVQAGELDKAFELYKSRLAVLLYFRFGDYKTLIELTHSLFLNKAEQFPNIKGKFEKAYILAMLGNAYGVSGQPHNSIKYYDSHNLLVKELDNKSSLAKGLGEMLSFCLLPIGALQVAEVNLRDSITVCQEIEDKDEESFSHTKLGLAMTYLGKSEEANAEFDNGEKISRELDNLQIQGLISAYRTLHSLLMMRLNPKLRTSKIKFTLQQAVHTLKLTDEETKRRYLRPRNYIRAYWLLGAAYCANNELALAEENLSKALNLCRQINMVDHEADILLELAKLRYAQKNYQESKSLVDEALTITERCGYVLQGADVNLFLSQYALEQEKDKKKAKEYAETALKLAYCDGPPYYYKVAYHEAEAMLEKLK